MNFPHKAIIYIEVILCLQLFILNLHHTRYHISSRDDLKYTGRLCRLYANRIASQVAQIVKNPPARQETRVPFLGWKNPLEKGMATHSNILAWRIPWTEEPGRPR